MLLSLFWISSIKVKKIQKSLSWKKYSYVKENLWDNIPKRWERWELLSFFLCIWQETGTKILVPCCIPWGPLSSPKRAWDCWDMPTHDCCVGSMRQHSMIQVSCTVTPEACAQPQQPVGVVTIVGDPRGTHHSLHKQKGALTYMQWPLMVRECTGHCRPVVWGMALPRDLPEWVCHYTFLLAKKMPLIRLGVILGGDMLCYSFIPQNSTDKHRVRRGRRKRGSEPAF